MKKSYARFFLVLLAGLLLVGVGGIKDSNAQSAAEYYKGKVVSFVVPYKPGGGTDLYARMVAPYLGKYLGATVIVKNMPGGGGTYGYNYVYNKKPDGRVVAITATGALILGSLLKNKGVQYDHLKFNWLGRLAWSKRVVLVSTKSSFRTLEDFKKAKKIKVAGTGKTDDTGMTVIMIAHALDIPPENITLVLGYGGGRPAMMSVMQGETDMTTLTEDTAANFVKAGLVKAFLTVDKERSRFFPDVPAFYETENPPADRGWPLAVYLDLQRLRRGVITSPNVPMDRVEFLRKALANVLKDKKFLASVAKKKRTIDALSGEQMEKLIREKVGKLSQGQIDEFTKIALEKYN